ncbi:hypothetical protein K402DRAFT_161301 [Aulographum hederae CBS 113979]|uniref:Uncharacterized protein n=1 Tax=Aulographum hederae CBS 113979 TaxID=1176131 RepID=A0A6G1GRZ3_9PEZI|nr:hypothetical protein K402DRAFT_161301 [Aulographum hederae CBS 113979]
MPEQFSIFHLRNRFGHHAQIGTSASIFYFSLHLISISPCDAVHLNFILTFQRLGRRHRKVAERGRSNLLQISLFLASSLCLWASTHHIQRHGKKPITFPEKTAFV